MMARVREKLGAPPRIDWTVKDVRCYVSKHRLVVGTEQAKGKSHR
jgi:hypothetical protein